MSNKVYCYARSSTADQTCTLKVQVEICRAEYDRRLKPDGWEWAGEWIDGGESASKPFIKRPKAFELDHKLEKGDIIIASKLDRVFRSMKDLVAQLESWEHRGIRLMLLDLNIDTGTPVGRLLTHLLGAVAEFERRRISERTREALTQKKAQGSHMGCVPYGFRRIRKKLVPDERQRVIGAKIVEWYQAGWTPGAICLNLFRHKIVNPRAHKNRAGKRGIYWSESIVKTWYAAEIKLRKVEEHKKLLEQEKLNEQKK